MTLHCSLILGVIDQMRDFTIMKKTLLTKGFAVVAVLTAFGMTSAVAEENSRAGMAQRGAGKGRRKIARRSGY